MNVHTSILTCTESDSVGAVFDLLLADPALANGPRERLACSQRKLSQVLGDLYDLTPDETALRRTFAALDPARFGIGPKRLRNIRNDLFLALQRAGLGARRIKDLPLTPAWLVLMDRITDKYHRDNLLPFARFCSDAGVAPCAWSDAVVEAYRQARAAEGVRDPYTSTQTTVRLLTRAAREVPGWPAVALTHPRRRVLRSLPLSAFPAAFVAELEAYLAAQRSDDPEDDRAPPKPLREGSIETKRAWLRRAVSELVHAGYPIEQFTSLACLAEPETFRALLRGLYAYTGRTKKQWIYEIAYTILIMARHWLGRDHDTLAPLFAQAAKYAPAKQAGLSEANEAKLRQFDDDTVDRFMAWSDRAMDRLVRADDGRRRTAERFQVALAFELELFTLVRIKNLVSLTEDEHLFWSKPNRGGTLTLAIPRAQVKNGQPIRIRLPEPVAARVRLYLERFQPRLLRPGADPRALFPGSRGRGRKRTDSLGRQLTRTIRRELDLRVNPHLFRHIGATLVLRDNPAAYNLASRILTHKSIETAFRHYSGLEIEQAFGLWDTLVLGVRATGGR